MQNLSVELSRRLIGHFVRQLTALSLNNVCLAWWDAIRLGIVAFADIVVDTFLVRPGGVFVCDQSFCWWFMLSFRSWHVVAIKNITHHWHGRWSNVAISSLDHLVHDLLELFLNIFSLLTQVSISDFGLAAFIFKNTLDLGNGASICSSRWKVNHWCSISCFSYLVSEWCCCIKFLSFWIE